MFNNTVELSAIKYWSLSARAELPEVRRPALDLLDRFTSTLAQTGIGRSEIIDQIRSLSSDYAELDKTLSSLNAVTVAGWLEQTDDRLYPSYPELSFHGATTARTGRTQSRNSIAKSTRLKVHARDEWTCWLCGYKTTESGISLPDSEDWDAALDHVTPHAHGGPNKIDNLRTAHRWCNTLRSDRPKPNALIHEIRVALRVSIQQVIIDNKNSGGPYQIPDGWRKAYTPRPRYAYVSV